jgi:hypothetical protein
MERSHVVNLLAVRQLFSVNRLLQQMFTGDHAADQAKRFATAHKMAIAFARSN